jgi:hypothetical protein
MTVFFFGDGGVQLPETDRGMFHYIRSVFSVQIKNKVGLTLYKVTDLRITLNLDGEPII